MIERQAFLAINSNITINEYKKSVLTTNFNRKLDLSSNPVKPSTYVWLIKIIVIIWLKNQFNPSSAFVQEKVPYLII